MILGVILELSGSLQSDHTVCLLTKFEKCDLKKASMAALVLASDNLPLAVYAVSISRDMTSRKID